MQTPPILLAKWNNISPTQIFSEIARGFPLLFATIWGEKLVTRVFGRNEF